MNRRARVLGMLVLAAASGCRRDATPLPVDHAPSGSVALPPKGVPVSAARAPTNRSTWFHKAGWAEGLPALRSACEAGAADAGAGVLCVAGQVVSVGFPYMDVGPDPSADTWLARFDALGDPTMSVLTNGAPRVHVLRNAELVVAYSRPTRRVMGHAVHLALDLAPEATLEALAKRLALGKIDPLRDGRAWTRALWQQRGPHLNLGATVGTVPGKSLDEVRLSLVNRSDAPLTLPEAGLTAPSTALEVWANGTPVHPGPPPTPPEDPPTFTLAPGETRTFDFRLSAYAGNLHGVVTVAPKRLGEIWLGAVETLELTLP